MFTVVKLLKQTIYLPDGVQIVSAVSSADNITSSCMYPICNSPYLIVTTCSDATIRFWKCYFEEMNSVSNEYRWVQWNSVENPEAFSIPIIGEPLCISAAYAGRIACAYKYGNSFTRPSKGSNQKYVNICISIYECESTGGEEWSLEDSLHVKNIAVPTNSISHIGIEISSTSFANPEECEILHKLLKDRLIQLDWASKEDGSHILTVAIGRNIMLFTAVSNDLAQANIKAMKESLSIKKPVLRKSSSFAQPHLNDEIRWMRIRQIQINTADGLLTAPRHLSWIKGGILIIGMDTEMQVYSQWKIDNIIEMVENLESVFEDRCLKDEDLKTLEQENFNIRQNTMPSMHELSKFSKINLKIMEGKKRTQVNINKGHLFIRDYMPDYGLFEASRVACPVLPQYHPKQLMEFLNSGKVEWVKAILSHLVHYISYAFKETNTEKDCFNPNNEVGLKIFE